MLGRQQAHVPEVAPMVVEEAAPMVAEEAFSPSCSYMLMSGYLKYFACAATELLWVSVESFLHMPRRKQFTCLI